MSMQITAEQEAMLPKIRDEWIAHGLSTEPADRPAAEDGVRMAYEAAGLTPPKFYFWAKSPWAGAMAQALAPIVIDELMLKNLPDAELIPAAQAELTRILDEIGTGPIPDAYLAQKDFRVRLEEWWQAGVWGQHWGGYYSHYAAMEALGVPGLEPIHGALKVAKSAGWWWCYDMFAVISERPSELHRNPQGQLHNETGPAMLYPDGWATYAWNGVRVPQTLIEGKWTTTEILREENAEVRRCAIEKMGWDRFVADANLTQVGVDMDDPGNPGHQLSLYDVPEQIYNEPVRVLLCDNATPERDGTRRRFGLTVPATVPDPIAAAAWTFGMNPDDYRQIVHAY